MSFAPTSVHKFWINFVVTLSTHVRIEPAFICHEYFWDCYVNIFVSIILSFIFQIKKSAFEKKISFEVLDYFACM